MKEVNVFGGNDQFEYHGKATAYEKRLRIICSAKTREVKFNWHHVPLQLLRPNGRGKHMFDSLFARLNVKEL